MYAFLLILGAVITASGIALLGLSFSIQEHAINTATVTPGAIAAIGGLILVGLGIAVRLLQRIESALAARPIARTAHPGEAAALTATAAVTSEPVNLPPPIPLQSKPKSEIQPPAAQVTTQTSALTPLADPALEQFREKFPSLVRLDSAPIAEQGATPPSRYGEEPAGVAANGHAAGPSNGAPSVATIGRTEATPRPVTAAERRKSTVFESLWPKGPRVGRQAQTAVAQFPAPAQAEPEQPSELRQNLPPAPIPRQAPTPVSILKSGVVDGMAYTLYSDGSIEAQLPQGTLRFGSITELRNHIEHSP
jgi:hypothetical protein